VLKRTAQAFVADDFRHAQYLGGDGIAAQSGEVRIAALSIKNRELPCAQDVAYLGGRLTFLPP
jgi:hypothetical protein